MTPREQRVLELWRRLDKWAFYEATRNYPVDAITRALGIRPDIVRMRRRDLRKMAPRP
jgi:hypothetical protein